MNVEEGFHEELYFSNEYDEIITQPGQYNWIPIWCSKCSQYGHSIGDCRLGKQWPSKPQLDVDDDGLRKYRKDFKRAVPNDLGHDKDGMQQADKSGNSSGRQQDKQP